MDDIDTTIVYLCFVLGWTFDYACEFVNKTPLKKLKMFMAELEYQKSIRDYQISSNSAMIICTWANSLKKGNRYRITDFIGKLPQRTNTKNKLAEAAEKANIKLPTGGLNDT